MEIRKIALISSIIVFLILISIFLYFYYFRPPPKTEPTYFSNIDQLYSSFTDYMSGEVDSRLQLLSCEPEEYYYDNSNLCFVCGDICPCFSYIMIDRRQEGIKMNPKDFPSVAGAEEFEVRIADFCKDGLASEFNCQEINEDYLECEKVRFVATSTGGIFKCDKVKLILKEGIELKDFAVDFCTLQEEEIEETTESFASCGRYTIVAFGESREIVIIEK